MTNPPRTRTLPTRAPTTAPRNPWAQTFIGPVPIAFVVGFAVVAALGAFGVPGLGTWTSWLTGGLALMFAVAASGRLHPRLRAGLAAMVPRALPRPELIVAATGMLELAGAVGLLVPATRTAAAICLALLLVAVFPANVRAARLGDRLGSLSSPLVPRTVEQVLFIAACLAVAFA